MPKIAKKKTAPAPGASASKAVRKVGKRRAPAIPGDVIGAETAFESPTRPERTRSTKASGRSQVPRSGGEPDVLNRLWSIIELRRAADPAVSHSARLLGRGVAKVAQKFGEEAVECLIEIVTGNRAAAVAESADVLYHLLVCWVEAGIRPEEVWSELEGREDASSLIDGPDGPTNRLLRSVQLGTRKIP